ncbi:MAG: hypothetical protein HC810_08735 [Acaryochloridaceae cyanobacterium RL_2_7]|nr:hypothetical protein [Acaryochloridaceae cyanobacterium RL_2_7]
MDAFYMWNKGKIPCKPTFTKRKELNQALGELAREAIDQNSSRFRLKEKFVTLFLGDADDENSLFHLSLQLGWLNRIGVAEENPFEGVYAFLHPTFQEYFVALVISKRDYFLPVEHIDQPIPGKRYRIFESNWEEVFLIWCGRNDVRKDILCLIQDLINFNDKDFFVFRAYFLAANAEPELNNYELSDTIINQLLDWGFFVEFRPNRSCFWNDSPIRLKAKETLKLTSFSKTVDSIVNQINLAENIHEKQDLAEFLGVIDPHNNQAVRVLTEIMNCTEHRMTQIDVAQSLWIADQANSNAISRFLDCLESKDHVIQDHAAYIIRESNIYSCEIIEKLISVLQRNTQEITFKLREVLRAIEAVGRGDRYIIDSIIELIEIHRKKESLQDVCILIWTLGEIGFKDSKASEYLLSLLKQMDDVAARCYIADGLEKFIKEIKMSLTL